MAAWGRAGSPSASFQSSQPWTSAGSLGGSTGAAGRGAATAWTGVGVADAGDDGAVDAFAAAVVAPFASWWAAAKATHSPRPSMLPNSMRPKRFTFESIEPFP